MMIIIALLLAAIVFLILAAMYGMEMALLGAGVLFCAVAALAVVVYVFAFGGFWGGVLFLGCVLLISCYATRNKNDKFR